MNPKTLRTGDELYAVIERLYPIMRSITGQGVRDSLAILAESIDLQVHAVASGEPVLDWSVPDEWVFHEARVDDAAGNRVLDTADSTLHVVNYSTGFDGTVSRDELLAHVHTLPEQPDAIPYRTSYYHRDWGLCMRHRQIETLDEGPFRVHVDATHRPGVLNYGEYVIPGTSGREILVSTHICHPSLANDNLSGMVLAAAWAQALSGRSRTAPHAQGATVGTEPTGVARPHFTWRFVFVPGTIGAITWLARHREAMPDVAAGLVITGLGDDARFTWKRTLEGDAWVDRVVQACLQARHPDGFDVIPFGPYGYDERQYASPGFALPTGRLTRGVHGTFPEYHTSNDDLAFVEPARLVESLELLLSIGHALEHDVVYRNLAPFGEPQLGRRGLYGSLGALSTQSDAQMAMLWLLNQSDGERSLTEIAAKAGQSPMALAEMAALLTRHELLRPIRHAGDDPTA